MAKTVATILSYGMGVESSAILLRWIMSPVTRPCSLEDLIVITSQVGDEYTDTGRDVEAHILPLMRRGYGTCRSRDMVISKAKVLRCSTIPARRPRCSWKATINSRTN